MIGGFFDKLNVDKSARSLRTDKSQEIVDKAAAIKKNLYVLLNSRQGSSSSAPDLGLVDFNDASLGSSDLILNVINNISTMIEKYEPRLLLETINFVPYTDSPLELSFKITGKIVVHNRESLLEIDMVMDANNQHYTIRH